MGIFKTLRFTSCLFLVDQLMIAHKEWVDKTSTETQTHWLPAIRLQQQKTSSVFAKTVTDIKASLSLCCLNDCQLVGKYSLDKIPSVVLLNFPFLTSKLQSFCHHTHSAACIAVVSCHCMIGHTTHTVSLYQ